MKGFNSQKGQALILIVFGIVALIGFTALAVDGGRVFSDRRNAQNAADTSALAAAWKYIDSRNDRTAAITEGTQRAGSNGYQTDADSTVEVVFCDTVKGTANECKLPNGVNPAEFVRVRITSIVPMTFGRVLGRDKVTNVVEALARINGTLEAGPFTAGAGMYATKRGNYNDCFKVLGSAGLGLHDTGIFVNCSGSNALSFGGSANIYMDANAQVVGCSDDKDKFTIGGTGKIDCGATEQYVDENTFANVPTTLPRPTCSTPGSHDSTNNVMYPGAFTSKTLKKDTVFMPGIYCFSGPLSLIAGANISATGPVKLVLSDSLEIKGNNNQFTDLEIYAYNSDFSVAAQGVLNANRMRFFGEKNSSFSVQAQGVLNSADIYIYSETGQIDIQAGAAVDITAPPQGDTFGGLLMYMPWNNPNDFMLNGGTGSIWRGTVLMPGAEVTYNGSSGFKLYGQVIAETFKINGNTGGDIYYDSDYVYSPPPAPSVEIQK
ncbi:MAG: pilus assembly protein TadG-related protein [Chloroflexota bacterium]